MMKSLFVYAVVVVFCNLHGYAQQLENWTLVRENIQKAFPASVPAANYSGITYLGDNHYALVDDKSADDGFEMFTINVDSLSGDIISVVYDGHVSGRGANRDQEGIAYIKSRNALLISGETDNMIIEYDMDGRQTGRAVILNPTAFNYGYEALSLSDSLNTIWTMSESTLPIDGEATSEKNGRQGRLRLQKFDYNLCKTEEYYYECDKPQARYNAWKYANGVSALTALDDGTLLVLEREFYVPELYSGAFALCKIYCVEPDGESLLNEKKPIDVSAVPMKKRLVVEWKTTLSLFRSTLANYEGMCVGPTLADGSQVILLVSDSQEQYGGVLKDYFKTIGIKKTTVIEEDFNEQEEQLLDEELE